MDFNFKLYRMGNKNANVMVTPNATVLFSYNTAVAKVEDGKLVMAKAATYSKTTAKHVREFVDRHAPSEFFGKRASVLVKEAKEGKNPKLLYQEVLR